MRRFMGCLLVLALLAGVCAAAKPDPFQQALDLQRAGKMHEAFLMYLSAPGGEYAAVALGRGKLEEYLALLRDPGNEIPAPREKIVEGDLLLAMGQKEEALTVYRAVAAMAATNAADGWAQGVIPQDYYFVEAEQQPTDNYMNAVPYYASRALLPMSIGDGSQRDNWLIRRFIALDALDDAAKEFARVWEIHRRNTHPYVVKMEGLDEKSKKVVQQRILVQPVGFTARGLQFALNYAYFLKRRQQVAPMRSVLLEPMLVMDMDRNPNESIMHRQLTDNEGMAVPLRDTSDMILRSFSMFGPIGISRKEYIRLAYGALKDDENGLVNAIRAQINKGDNRARRVLAAIRLQQNDVTGALAQELAYIDAGSFTPLTKAYRRALAYDAAQKLPEAAAAFEKVLTLPYAPTQLPDKDEEIQQGAVAQRIVFAASANSPIGKMTFQHDIIMALQRIYGALNKPARVLDLELRYLGSSELALEDLSEVSSSAHRFQVARQTPRFNLWVKTRLKTVSSPLARANLCWTLGDYPGAIAALAQYTAKTTPALPRGAYNNDKEYVLRAWKERFSALGKSQSRALLLALVKADPKDYRSRLELLDSPGTVNPTEMINMLAALLDAQTRQDLFFGYKGNYIRTQFRDYFDLGYRLMRLYEKTGQVAKMQALALRIAHGEKPFSYPDFSQSMYRDSNGILEDTNAALALAIARAPDVQTRAALAAALQKSPWVGAQAQLARVQDTAPAELKAMPPFGWANLPKNTRVLAGNESVLCLCRDDKALYAGQPWGIAVYDLQGNPITRLATQGAVRNLALLGQTLYAVGDAGLFRVDTRTFAVTALAMTFSETNNYVGPDWKGRLPYGSNPLLAVHDGMLWLGAQDGIYTVNPATDEVRAFSARELGLSDRNLCQCRRFLFDGAYVWADGGSGCRRYDTRSNTWQTLDSPNPQYPINLVKLIDGVLWGQIWLNDTLRYRLCRIDRETLRVTPILLNDSDGSARYNNGPISYSGSYQGKPVFSLPGRPYYYDATSNSMEPIPQNENGQLAPIDFMAPEGLRSGNFWRRPDGSLECNDSYTHRHSAFGQAMNMSEWTFLTLPDGSSVLGGQYDGALEDLPDDTGGLWFISPEGKARVVSAFPHADTLLGDEVNAILPYNGQYWLCTSRGLVVLNNAGQVLARYTREDGLSASRFTSAAALGGKLYFAAHWGDNGGGLTVYDPKTTLFTSLAQQDELASNYIDSLLVMGNTLQLNFGVQYRRYLRGGGYKYHKFPPMTYTPATGTFSPIGQPVIKDSVGAFGKKAMDLKPCPYLGGELLWEQVIDGKRFLGGSHGLLILPLGDTPNMDMAVATLKVITDPQVTLLAAAMQRTVTNVKTPDELKTALTDANPFYRARVMATLNRQQNDFNAYIDELATQVDDPVLNTRATALYFLSRCTDNARVIPLMQARLADSYAGIRTFAALELARPWTDTGAELAARNPHSKNAYVVPL